MSEHQQILDQGDPAEDGRAFRRCLGQFTTGVTVMTAQHEGVKAGMIVNSFAAVSLEPPLVLWSLRRESRNLPLFSDASHFAVNVLSMEQVDLSQMFASSSGDKFDALDWAPGAGGAPLLQGTVAQFECRREAMYEGGDHWIVLGRVVRYSRFGGEPLVFSQGRYAAVQEHPAVAAAQKAAATESNAADRARPRDTFMRMLLRAGHYVSAAFDDHRLAEGLTLPQARVLSWLYGRPTTVNELKRTIYLGSRDTEDAVAELVNANQVARRPDGCLELTAEGRRRRENINARVSGFETQLLQGIPAAEVEIVRRVLNELTAKHAPQLPVVAEVS